MPQVTDTDKTRIVLAWTPPKDDGGSDVFNYVVEMRDEGAFKWKRVTDGPVATTTCEAARLREGGAYEFRVAAENRAGVGAFSENTMPVKAAERIGERRAQ